MNHYRLASFFGARLFHYRLPHRRFLFQSPQILRAQDVDVPTSLTMQVNTLTLQVNALANQLNSIAQMVPSGGFSAY